MEECIRSVMNQSITEGVECIIVDDCGQDNSMEIVESILANDGYTECEDGTLTSTLSPLTFRILHHEHNRGLSAARNTGIYAAKGEYVYFIDSDDYIYENCISSFFSVAAIYPEADIIQGSFYAEDQAYNKHLHSGVDIPTETDYIDNLSLCRKHLQRCGCLPMMPNRLIKTSFIRDNNLLAKEGIIHEDHLWTFMAGKHIRRMAYCKTDTYFYRSNSTGIMSSSNNKKHAVSLSTICDEIFLNLPLNRWFNVELNYLLWEIHSIEKYGYEDPFVFMEYSNNRFVRNLYKNYSQTGHKYTFFKRFYKIVVYLNIFMMKSLRSLLRINGIR